MTHSIFVTAAEFMQHKAIREGRPIYNKDQNYIGKFVQNVADGEMIEIDGMGRKFQMYNDLCYVQVICEPIWI
jgi:hypothetical protein